MDADIADHSAMAVDGSAPRGDSHSTGSMALGAPSTPPQLLPPSAPPSPSPISPALSAAHSVSAPSTPPTALSPAIIGEVHERDIQELVKAEQAGESKETASTSAQVIRIPRARLRPKRQRQWDQEKIASKEQYDTAEESKEEEKPRKKKMKRTLKIKASKSAAHRRLPWREDELLALKAGVARYGRDWASISNDNELGRTLVNRTHIAMRKQFTFGRAMRAFDRARGTVHENEEIQQAAMTRRRADVSSEADENDSEVYSGSDSNSDDYSVTSTAVSTDSSSDSPAAPSPLKQMRSSAKVEVPNDSDDEHETQTKYPECRHLCGCLLTSQMQPVDASQRKYHERARHAHPHCAPALPCYKLLHVASTATKKHHPSVRPLTVMDHQASPSSSAAAQSLLRLESAPQLALSSPQHRQTHRELTADFTHANTNPIAQTSFLLQQNLFLQNELFQLSQKYQMLQMENNSLKRRLTSLESQVSYSRMTEQKAQMQSQHQHRPSLSLHPASFPSHETISGTPPSFALPTSFSALTPAMIGHGFLTAHSSAVAPVLPTAPKHTTPLSALGAALPAIARSLPATKSVFTSPSGSTTPRRRSSVSTQRRRSFTSTTAPAATATAASTSSETVSQSNGQRPQ